MKGLLRRNDLILFTCLVLIISLCACLFYFNKSGESVEVLVDGNVIKTLSLKEDCEYKIGEGEKLNILAIKNGEAYIKDASCPDLICKNHRAIKRVGETIVCLPNKVAVRVVSIKSGLDITI